MASAGGRRVTVVDPWVAGGDGQLRDLFPLPPALVLTGRAIKWAGRHYVTSLISIASLILWIWGDWSWFGAFVIFPLLVLSLKLILRILYLWYRNPAVPLIARK